MSLEEKRVAIVTGASSGIGKETVLRLIRQGYEVHAAARRVEAMRDLESAGARVHFLDLTKPESIDACVGEVLAASGGRIDALVNNAGFGCYGAVEDVPLALAREEMEVNLFGLAHMTQAVLPAMRQRRAGRIVNVTSIGGKIWSLLGGWYHASKFAVEGLSDSLRNELRPFGIDVVLVEPGGVRTEWAGIAVENMKKNSGAGPYKALVEAAAGVFSLETGLAAPALIAEVICRAATARRPKIRYVAPLAGRVILWLRWALSDRAFDRLFSKIFRIPAAIHAPVSIRPETI